MGPMVEAAPIDSPVKKLEKIEFATLRLNQAIIDIGTSNLKIGAGIRLNLEALSGKDYALAAIEVGQIRARIKDKNLPSLEEKAKDIQVEIAQKEEQEALIVELKSLLDTGNLTQDEYNKAISEFQKGGTVGTLPDKPETTPIKKGTIFLPQINDDRLRALHYIVDFGDSLDPQIITSMIKLPTFANRNITANKEYTVRSIRKSLNILFIRDQREVLTTKERAVSERLLRFMEEMNFERLAELKDWVFSRFDLSDREKLSLGIINNFNDDALEQITFEEAYAVVTTLHMNSDLLKTRTIKPIPDEMIDSFKEEGLKLEPVTDQEHIERFLKGVSKLRNIVIGGKLEDVYGEVDYLTQDLIAYFCIAEGSRTTIMLEELYNNYSSPTSAAEAERPGRKMPVQSDLAADKTQTPSSEADLKPSKSSEERTREKITISVEGLVDEVFKAVDANQLAATGLMNSNQVNRVIQRLKESDTRRIIDNGHVTPNEVRGRIEYFDIYQIVKLLYYRDSKSGLPKKYERELEKIVKQIVDKAKTQRGVLV